jgi:hypothetical protein
MLFEIPIVLIEEMKDHSTVSVDQVALGTSHNFVVDR